MFTLSLFIVCLGNWKDYVRWGIAWWSRCLPQSPFSLLDVVTTLMLLMVMVMVPHLQICLKLVPPATLLEEKTTTKRLRLAVSFKD